MVLQEFQREHFPTRASDPAVTDSQRKARFCTHRDENKLKVNRPTLFISHEFPSQLTLLRDQLIITLDNRISILHPVKKPTWLSASWVLSGERKDPGAFSITSS